MREKLFQAIRWVLVATTGVGYDRSPRINDLHHKLAYRLHTLLPMFGIRGIRRISVAAIAPHHLYVRADDGGVGHQFLMYGEYEPFESSVVQRYVKPGMTVYNIGANVGYYVVLTALATGPNGKVIALEPAEDNHRLLERTISENGLGNVTVVRKAAGASLGKAELSLSQANSGDHQLQRVPGRESVTVDVTTVDAIIAGGMPRPDVVILDVQGSELDVIRGMAQTLSQRDPMTLFTEFWPRGLDARVENGARIYLELLESYGFEIYEISEAKKILTKRSADELLRSIPGNEERNLLCIRS